MGDSEFQVGVRPAGSTDRFESPLRVSGYVLEGPKPRPPLGIQSEPRGLDRPRVPSVQSLHLPFGYEVRDEATGEVISD